MKHVKIGYMCVTCDWTLQGVLGDKQTLEMLVVEHEALAQEHQVIKTRISSKPVKKRPRAVRDPNASV